MHQKIVEWHTNHGIEYTKKPTIICHWEDISITKRGCDFGVNIRSFEFIRASRTHY